MSENIKGADAPELIPILNMLKDIIDLLAQIPVIRVRGNVIDLGEYRFHKEVREYEADYKFLHTAAREGRTVFSPDEICIFKVIHSNLNGLINRDFKDGVEAFIERNGLLEKEGRET